MRLPLTNNTVAFVAADAVESIRIDGSSVVLTTDSGSNFFPEIHNDGCEATTRRLMESIDFVLNNGKKNETD